MPQDQLSGPMGTPLKLRWNTGGVIFFSRKHAISLKRGQIGPKLPLMTNRKCHTCFQFVPKAITMDDLEWPVWKCVCFQSPPRKNSVHFSNFWRPFRGLPSKFSGSLSLAIFSGPLNILVVIRALRILIMQCNAMSITEAGQRPLFQTLSKNKIIKHRIDSRIKLYYTSGHKSLSSK